MKEDNELEDKPKTVKKPRTKKIENEETKKEEQKVETIVIEEPVIEEKEVIDIKPEVITEPIKEKELNNTKEFAFTEANASDTGKKIGIILSIIITFFVCLALFGFFYKFYLENLVVETTKVEKDVTVTDTGIADAVDKVYDSVVVVENYVNGKLYSTGTGFVYKTDNTLGYILTNAHVVANSTTVKVIFTNNESVEVNLIGSDTFSDIAVLSVPKENVISVAEIGSSLDLRVGDTSFAVGAPIDANTYSWTVTRGIISGKDRKIEVSSSTDGTKYVVEVLQTDTAINNGNSGGPLCNSNGEVIGITNMKLASTSIEGMAFAIPIETAVNYADKFISGEEVERPYIGVNLYNMTATIYNNNTSGVYITKVEENSPASKAGLQKGDIIKELNDEEITDVSFFKYELYKYNIGDKVTITIERDGEEKDIEVTLGSSK